MAQITTSHIFTRYESGKLDYCGSDETGRPMADVFTEFMNETADVNEDLFKDEKGVIYHGKRIAFIPGNTVANPGFGICYIKTDANLTEEERAAVPVSVVDSTENQDPTQKIQVEGFRSIATGELFIFNYWEQDFISENKIDWSNTDLNHYTTDSITELCKDVFEKQNCVGDLGIFQVEI